MTETTAILPERVLVVVGPTAVGKTDLAAELARRLDAEVVGVDSRQVYRHMDVGTAKPDRLLLGEIRHHMVDVVAPDEHFDVARWREGVTAALAGIQRRGKRAILCGGTGLYLRSIFRGLFSGPGADIELRKTLVERERAEAGWLRARLLERDPNSAARIHANDQVRTIRALEVLELTGRRLSEWHRSDRGTAAPFGTGVVQVSCDREALYRRIERRSQGMVAAGLVDELRGLYADGYAPGLKAFSAIGYREAAQCIEGSLDSADLVGAVSRATKRYAKRQSTWLRHQLPAGPRTEVAPGGHEEALTWSGRYFDA